LQALLETNTFFSRQQARGAEHMLEHEKLGLGKFEAVLDLLIRDPTRTPRPRRGSLGDCLGPFAHLVSLHRRLGDLGGRSRPRARKGPVTRPEDAPWADRFADPGRHRPDDDGSPLQPFQNRSGRTGTYHLARDETEDDFSDGDDSDDDGRDGDRGDSVGVPEPTKSRPLPPPKRRTPAETIVVNFLVNAIAAVAMQIQPVQSAPVCVADAREQTFKFGPVAPTGCHPVPQAAAAPASKEGKTARDQEQEFGRAEEKGETRASRRPAQPAAFRARVDGGIPTCPTPADGDGLVAVFEAKRYQRDDNDVEVRAQQTMEHVAVIWEKHKGYKVGPNMLFFSLIPPPPFFLLSPHPSLASTRSYGC